MLVFCEQCEEETYQELISVYSNLSSDDFLLTTYRCERCRQLNYGHKKREKGDAKKYPKIPLIPPEKMEQVIKSSQNWSPRKLEFTRIDGKPYIVDKQEGEKDTKNKKSDIGYQLRELLHLQL